MWRVAAALVCLSTTAVAGFCPTAWCVRGGGPWRTDCLVEWTGIRFDATTCVDGAACDLDATANGSCRFSVGPCLDVSSTCPTTSPPVQQFVVEPASLPAATTIRATLLALATDRPGVARCASPIAVDVPVGTGTAAGTLILRTVATAAGARDRDRLTFRCLPPGTRPSFAADVAPILAARCTPGCHEPGGKLSTVNLTPDSAYGALIPRHIRPGRPQGTALMVALRYRMPPGCFRRIPGPEWAPGGCPTRAEKKIVSDWIRIGAPNN